LTSNKKAIRLAVIADTHIPDHIKRFPKGVLKAIADADPDQILHAGDISSQRVIDELNKIAPVTAVQGNRDWLFQLKIDPVAHLEIYGQSITLCHGHGTLFQYVFDKFVYFFQGYRFARYQKMLAQTFPASKVIIFGHTHIQAAAWVGEQLFFNPGSIFPCQANEYHPEYGILTITPEGEIRTSHHRCS
jgi:uncharacterized protein